jgi:hypothetical protein
MECVCRYFLKAALNFALSFLRMVTLGGKLLKTFMPAENVLFWKQDRLAFFYKGDAYSWYCV